MKRIIIFSVSALMIFAACSEKNRDILNTVVDDKNGKVSVITKDNKLIKEITYLPYSRGVKLNKDAILCDYVEILYKDFFSISNEVVIDYGKPDINPPLKNTLFYDNMGEKICEVPHGTKYKYNSKFRALVFTNYIQTKIPYSIKSGVIKIVNIDNKKITAEIPYDKIEPLSKNGTGSYPKIIDLISENKRYFYHITHSQIVVYDFKENKTITKKIRIALNNPDYIHHVDIDNFETASEGSEIVYSILDSALGKYHSLDQAEKTEYRVTFNIKNDSVEIKQTK